VTALTKQDASGIPALQMTEGELVNVLATSLYPGAQVTSIKMAIGYCKATGLDPMQKPVHIVPMWDSKAGQMRDVIMPGIGLYRTQASRSQQMAGISEPEFGPMVETQIGGQDVTYPEWCRVTVKRLLPSGAVAEFTAVEYWMENYAVKGGQQKSIAPNAMWSKRPRGQLAKCAEAQALRKAFPEIGAQPTAEEMEGKGMDGGIVFDAATGKMASAAADQPGESQQSDESAELIDAGQAASKEGMEKLNAWWATLTPKQRNELSRDFGQMRKTARLADEKGPGNE